MASSSLIPAQTGFSRVFVIEGRARSDHKPTYLSSTKAGSLSWSFGDITKIEVPDPNQHDRFLEVGTIRGARERATITLTGRYAREVKSTLLRLGEAECPVDVQITFGACTDPSDYNTFTKKIILEDARITSYDTEDLGALASDERAKIDESVNISARDAYEIVQVSFSSKAGSIVANELIDVVICDTASCGDCDEESSGYDKVFALSISAGASPATTPDVIFSLDKGSTWYAHDVDSITGGEDPDAIACLGDYLFVVSEDTESAHYALKSEFDGTSDPTFAEVTTGFVAGGGPRAVAVGVSRAFIVGAGGYIYTTEDITAGVTVRDAGTLYSDSYNAVDALNDDFAVAVGINGRVVKTENGTSWETVNPPFGVATDINAICLKTTSHWIIGSSTGRQYYTTDGGTTWTEKTFSGSGSGVVRDIVVAKETVLYMAHDTTTPRGRILRSSNGGYDWKVLPEGSGVLPLQDRINALATSDRNPDFVVGVGLADDGSDGVILVGTD